MRAPPLLLLAGWTLCALLTDCRQEAPSAPVGEVVVLGAEDVLHVEVAHLEAGPLLAGTLEPATRATLRAEVAGSAVEVLVDVGDRVTRGQLLCRLEDAERRSALGAADAALHLAKHEAARAAADEARSRRLVDAGAVAARELESAERAAGAARARVEEARTARVVRAQQLDHGAVRAPFAGVVQARLVHVGDVLAPGAPLFMLFDPSTLRLEAYVQSDGLPDLREGLPVIIDVRGSTTPPVRGVLDRIAPAADPLTGQVEVMASVPNQNGALVAGLFTTGRILTDVRDAVAVPAAALLDEASAPAVLRIHHDAVERTPVTPGMRDDVRELVEVVAGLAAGDVVVVGPARTLRPGTRVRLPRAEPITSASPTSLPRDDGARTFPARAAASPP